MVVLHPFWSLTDLAIIHGNCMEKSNQNIIQNIIHISPFVLQEGKKESHMDLEQHEIE